LGQWVFDVLCLLDWLAIQPGLDRRRFAVAGLGQAGLVALCSAGLFDERVATTIAIESPVTYVTDEAYAAGTHMGLLAPGILRWVDVPHLAALAAPRRLIVAEGVSPQGKKLAAKEVQESYGFTRQVYEVYKAQDKLTVAEQARVEEIAAAI
jgi:hypothetical protein